jgi:hypothetical protein
VGKSARVDFGPLDIHEISKETDKGMWPLLYNRRHLARERNSHFFVLPLEVTADKRSHSPVKLIWF